MESFDRLIFLILSVACFIGGLAIGLRERDAREAIDCSDRIEECSKTAGVLLELARRCAERETKAEAEAEELGDDPESSD
jgi:hypothetical protein